MEWGGRAGSSPRILKRLLEERGWQQCLLRDSIKEHNCLFWRAGSDTASVTSFATIMQGKAGKIPQSEIVSACGQVGAPNLDSGIWWENGKCIRGDIVNLRFITTASGSFQRNQQVVVRLLWRRREGEGPAACCRCDQPVKIFEQMEKNQSFFHDTFLDHCTPGYIRTFKKHETNWLEHKIREAVEAVGLGAKIVWCQASI